MHQRLIERWVTNIKQWRKEKLPIKEVIERMSVLSPEEQELVRTMVYKSNTEVSTSNEPKSN